MSTAGPAPSSPAASPLIDFPPWRAFLAPFAELPKETLREILESGDAKPPEKWMLLIEPRAHALLVAVAKHAIALLGPLGWGMVLLHGKRSGPALAAALPRTPKLILGEIPTDNLPLPQYSALMLSPFVWENLCKMGAKQVLTLQTDALILNPARVDAFAGQGWDYVGAPWAENAWGEGRKPTHDVGNGGFSLRNPHTMLRIARALEGEKEGDAGEEKGDTPAKNEQTPSEAPKARAKEFPDHSSPWALAARRVRDSGRTPSPEPRSGLAPSGQGDGVRWIARARRAKDNGAPEDIVFSGACVGIPGARVPGKEEAAAFAVETIAPKSSLLESAKHLPGGLHNPGGLPPNDLLLLLARRWALSASLRGTLSALPPSPPRLLRLTHPRDHSPPEDMLPLLRRADRVFDESLDAETAAGIYARAYRHLRRMLADLPHPSAAPASHTLRTLHVTLRRVLSYVWAPAGDLREDLPAALCRQFVPPAWPAPRERPDPKMTLQRVNVGGTECQIEVEDEAWMAEERARREEEARHIRVGYVGPDFNRNAVGLFLGPLLARHDPARFRIFVYNTCAAGGDRVTEYLRGVAEKKRDSEPEFITWVEAGHLSDDALADLMRREHRLDILVDLIAGGVGGRVDLAARRPAAAVVNYLGFPERVGMPGVYTHRISDPLAEGNIARRVAEGNIARRVPEGNIAGKGKGASHESESAEKMVLLREAPFVCYSHWEAVFPSPPIAPRPPPHPRAVRVGLFARAHKHHPRLRDILRRTLASAPNMHLVLKQESKRSVSDLYPAAQFPRTVALAFRGTHTAFMDGFNRVDVIADSQPYSGTTITCAALYMGVPVLSLLDPKRNRHVSHVSAALVLHTQRALDADPALAAALPARLDETFVARSAEDYEQRLIHLATQTPEYWEGWRNARHAIASAFRAAMDPERFIRDLERAYEEIHAER